MKSRASRDNKRMRSESNGGDQPQKGKQDPSALKKAAVEAPMSAVKTKVPAAKGAARQHVKYRTKSPEDIARLRQSLRPVKLIHDDPVQRPGFIVAKTGMLGDQLGVYAEKDIIVGRSAKTLLGYYAGTFSEVLAETKDTNHYVFEHDEGGAIDGDKVRNWAAFINHSEVHNVIPVSKVRKDGRKEIWLYAVNDIQAKQPLYINYGLDYFDNMPFSQMYLGRHDNWETPEDVWQRNPEQYCQHAFQFNESTRESLGLLSAGAYVIPKLFKAVMDRDLKTVEAMLNDKGCVVELTPLAIDEKTGRIAATDQQEKVTPFMLACHLGAPAIIVCFMQYYKKYMAKKEDFTLFSDRSWRTGKTPLMYLLNGMADRKTKQDIFATFIELKKKLEKGKFDLQPYFVLTDYNYESLLGYCINHQLHDAVRLMFEDVDLKEELYEVMHENRCHANVATSIGMGDLVMLDILLKHAPDREQIKGHIDSNYINIRKFESQDVLRKAQPVLQKYLNIIQLSKFAGGIFNPRKESVIMPVQPAVKPNKRAK